MSGICWFSGAIVLEVGNAGDLGVGSDNLCVVSKGMVDVDCAGDFVLASWLMGGLHGAR